MSGAGALRLRAPAQRGTGRVRPARSQGSGRASPEPAGPPTLASTPDPFRSRDQATANTLASELARLATLDRAGLREEWARLYRSHPPQKLSRDLLKLVVAWKLQAMALGGLGGRARRQLDELASALGSKSDLLRERRVSLKPGARIVREWAGETHEILVTEDGFVWRDQTWASLSAIAREMTGTRWSGPRFFGLERGRDTRRGRGPEQGGCAAQ